MYFSSLLHVIYLIGYLCVCLSELISYLEKSSFEFFDKSEMFPDGSPTASNFPEGLNLRVAEGYPFFIYFTV